MNLFTRMPDTTSNNLMFSPYFCEVICKTMCIYLFPSRSFICPVYLEFCHFYCLGFSFGNTHRNATYPTSDPAAMRM